MTQDLAVSWYSELIKPSFAPPAWVFGPVWSVLYVLIAVSFGYVFLRVIQGKLPQHMAWPFALNLCANALFSPLQFWLQNNFLALVDIGIVWGTIIWMMYVTWRRARWVAWMQVPYLLWVSFASVLQISITWLNW